MTHITYFIFVIFLKSKFSVETRGLNWQPRKKKGSLSRFCCCYIYIYIWVWVGVNLDRIVRLNTPKQEHADSSLLSHSVKHNCVLQHELIKRSQQRVYSSSHKLIITWMLKKDSTLLVLYWVLKVHHNMQLEQDRTARGLCPDFQFPHLTNSPDSHSQQLQQSYSWAWNSTPSIILQ